MKQLFLLVSFAFTSACGELSHEPPECKFDGFDSLAIASQYLKDIPSEVRTPRIIVFDIAGQIRNSSFLFVQAENKWEIGEITNGQLGSVVHLGKSEKI
ncbi:MAG: hypothetical protein AAFY07_14095, partial [Pseudomonadota bacterium]